MLFSANVMDFVVRDPVQEDNKKSVTLSYKTLFCVFKCF